MEKKLYEAYLELCGKLVVLDKEKRELAVKITEKMEAEEIDSVKGDSGIITLAERTSYKYTEEVIKKNDELKELKKVEESTGVAEKKITKYLRATVK